MLRRVFSALLPLAAAALLGAKAEAVLIPSASLSIQSNSMGASTGFSDTNMINGSGLASYAASSPHAALASNSWFSANGNVTGNIVFDLGAVNTIDAFHLWNESTGGIQRVVQMQIETSFLPASGFSFTSLGAGPLNVVTPAPAGQVDPIAAATFSFTPVSARYVRLTIVANGGSTGFTGIREVAFDLPEPSTLLLSGSGVAVLTILGRRRRRG